VPIFQKTKEDVMAGHTFDKKEGRWLDENGIVIIGKGAITTEEILDAYIDMYQKALKAGGNDKPDFTKHNAAELVKVLGHRASLSNIRGKVAKARKWFDEAHGNGPYSGRSGATYLPTLRVEASVVDNDDSARKEMVARLHAKYFGD